MIQSRRVIGASQFGMMNNIRSMVTSSGYKIDPITDEWAFSKIPAAGGTVGLKAIITEDTYIKTGRTNGWLSNIKFKLPLVGDQLAAALVPIINTGDWTVENYNNLFIEAHYSQNNGLITTVANSHLKFNFKPSDLGTTLAFLGVYSQDGVGGDLSFLGCNDAGFVNRFFIDYAVGAYRGFVNGTSTSAATYTVANTTGGRFIANRSAPNRCDLYLNGVSVGNNTNVIVPTSPDVVNWAFGKNNNGLLNGRPAGKTLSDIIFGTSMTTAQALAEATAEEVRQVAYGRGVV